jgi:hypothetical protein
MLGEINGACYYLWKINFQEGEKNRVEVLERVVVWVLFAFMELLTVVYFGLIDSAKVLGTASTCCFCWWWCG